MPPLILFFVGFSNKKKIRRELRGGGGRGLFSVSLKRGRGRPRKSVTVKSNILVYNLNVDRRRKNGNVITIHQSKPVTIYKPSLAKAHLNFGCFNNLFEYMVNELYFYHYNFKYTSEHLECILNEDEIIVIHPSPFVNGVIQLKNSLFNTPLACVINYF